MSSLVDSPVDAGQHVVQFYERDAELVAGVGEYLSDAAASGAVSIVIATPEHREAFARHLAEAGVDTTNLISLDAAATLARFTRDGVVDRDRFFDVVGGVVREAVATGRPVRAYGEMVALLWEAGHVVAAIDLETLWNELGSELPFALYCAYRSDSVAGHEHADALQHVCHLHTAVVATSVEATWEFAADPAAPEAARRLAIDALRGAGHDARILENARVVVSELAANAVLHARSPFSVSVRSDGSTIRVRVRDGGGGVPAIPEESATRLSGRGLRLVNTLARRWGVDRVAGGKVVWAELGR